MARSIKQQHSDAGESVKKSPAAAIQKTKARNTRRPNTYNNCWTKSGTRKKRKKPADNNNVSTVTQASISTKQRFNTAASPTKKTASTTAIQQTVNPVDKPKRKPAKKRNPFLQRYQNNGKRKGKGKKTDGANTTAFRFNQSAKTAVALRKNPALNTPLRKAYQEFIEGDISSIASNRETMVTKRTKHGSPKELVGVNGTPYRCKTDLGYVKYFTENVKHPAKHPRYAAQKQLSFDKLDDDTLTTQTSVKISPEAKIKSCPDSFKLQEELITTSSIAKATTEKRADNGRHITQNQVMGGSATKYGNNVLIYKENVPWKDILKSEWLHEIPHRAMGRKSQTVDNLVGGTAYANTEMIPVEDELAYLAKEYPQGFTYKVKAHMIPQAETGADGEVSYTQMASLIKVRIILPNFTIKYDINALSHNKPDLALKHYISAQIRSYVAADKKVKAAAANNTNNTTTSSNNTTTTTPATPSASSQGFSKFHLFSSSKTKQTSKSETQKKTKIRDNDENQNLHLNKKPRK